MASDRDKLLGRLAVQHSFCSAEQVAECIDAQGFFDSPPPLGQMLIEKGYLDQSRLQELLALQEEWLSSQTTRRMRRSPAETLFGRLAVRFGLVTADQLNACIREQASDEEAGRPVRRLGEILVEKKYLTSIQVQLILEKQDKTLVLCEGCGRRYNVFGVPRGRKVKCPKCGSPIEPSMAFLEEVDADDSIWNLDVIDI